MKIYLYPGYVSLGSSAGGSPRLFRYLENERKVKLEDMRWHGTLDSLPKNPSMIRASSMMKCESYDLAKKCAELGHFCFYNDQVLLPNGEYVGGDRLIEEAQKFLDAHGKDNEPMVSRELTIAYLRSAAANSSTAGKTIHAMKQAQLLLDLFTENVLCDDVSPVAGISGGYPIVRVVCAENLRDLDEGDTLLDGLGFDRKGMEQLGRQLAEDVEKASGLPYDEPLSQMYYHKLARALRNNLGNLKLAYESTELDYLLVEHQPSMGILAHAILGRHSQWAGVTFIRMLMDAMLPVLVERLLALGYPNSSEVAEWDYEMESHK
jgi:hypothetical protein